MSFSNTMGFPSQRGFKANLPVANTGAEAPRASVGTAAGLQFVGLPSTAADVPTKPRFRSKCIHS